MKKTGCAFAFILALLLLGAPPLEAAVRTSNGTGGGTRATGTTWVGRVAPGAGDDAIIAAGDTVTLGGATSITNVTINSTGILAGSTFLLTVSQAAWQLAS